jgi:pectate lyase
MRLARSPLFLGFFTFAVGACSGDGDDAKSSTGGGAGSGGATGGAGGSAGAGGASASGGSGGSGGGAGGSSASGGTGGGTGGSSGTGGDVRAFPGAEGFGSETPGGRGGKVYVVTTLDWEGAGSFSEALYAREPRIIVFRVSGVIDVPDNAPGLEPEHSFVTVAGQTSPGGVTFHGGGAALNSYHTDFHDAVFRFLRFRGNVSYDNVALNEAHHFIFDHCDFSGGEDETFDVTFGHDFTVQWSTITNSGPNGQTYGQLMAYAPTSRISMHHNLSAHHVNRCGPHMHWGDTGTPAEGALIDYRNNVIYDCAFEKGLDVADPISGSIQLNLVGNYAKAGPNTPATAALIGIGSAASVYESDNVYEPGHDIFTIWSEPTQAGQAFDFPAVTTQPASTARDSVLDLAGAWPRDAMNQRTVGEVRSGTGVIGKVDDALITSGPEAPADADLDGMPDVWETDHGLAPDDPTDAAAAREPGGYTNIEEYVNQLADSLVGKS